MVGSNECCSDLQREQTCGCGFDSIPSDIGTLLVQDYAQEEFGTSCSRIRTYVTSPTFELSEIADASSGGTMSA